MSETKTNKTKEIVKYMKKHKGITSKVAFEQFGVTRLSSIIFNLRNAGYVIQSERVELKKDRYGNPGSYAKYTLISVPKADSQKKGA